MQVFASVLHHVFFHRDKQLVFLDVVIHVIDFFRGFSRVVILQMLVQYLLSIQFFLLVCKLNKHRVDDILSCWILRILFGILDTGFLQRLLCFLSDVLWLVLIFNGLLYLRLKNFKRALLFREVSLHEEFLIATDF